MLENRNLACLIIGYLRASELISLTSFAINYGIHNIYIAIDGPKNRRDSEIQSSVIQAIQELEMSKNQTIYLRNSWGNHGAAVSVIKAIDWVSRNENEFIILEDDLVPGEDFIPFVREMLKKYRDNDDVLLVSGNRFFQIENQTCNEILVKFPLIWGWGTNTQKWSIMRQGIIDSSYERSHQPIRSGKLRAFLRTGASRSRSGQIDAWDLPLAYWMFKNRKLCVLPPVNLVTNVGSDANALHTKQSTWPLYVPTGRISKLEQMEYGLNKTEYRREEQLIEKKIYKVKFHHLFSPFIYRIVDLVLMRVPNFSQSLEKRLESAETFEGFEITLSKGQK